MFLKRIILCAVLMFSASATVEAQTVETDPVVATVNGVEIRLSDVDNARNLLPVKLQVAPMRDVYPILMEALVNVHLAAGKARELGYHKTPEFKRKVEQASNQFLQRMMLERHISARVTEEMIKERYAAQIDAIKDRFETRARHILVEDEDYAKTLIEELEDGADFAELASKHSTGPTKANGGKLGWFIPGQMVKEFEEAASVLDTGEHSQIPVKTRFGWHVILVEERRPLTLPDYQELRTLLTNDVSTDLGNQFMEQLRSEAKIEKKSFQEVLKALQE
ncbi:peptidylprolyl isomerase [Magnetovibrio sp. PR-2]|uniref:peptidylprolyl isomerase n=1 Tax=Magnetovibrio sp. PR-2 TaxID=3120356 RepID=UPI002FCE2866